ncbi:hypothetical protein FACS1894216_01410 [Synergistales bacterium]|nr:hypothetical protein FACS1894216_01410 [Synergistales bacterium]
MDWTQIIVVACSALQGGVMFSVHFFEALLFLASPLIYLAAHEFGHYAFALFFGLKPRMSISGFHIIINFTTPEEPHKLRLVMEAGFGVGLLLAAAALGAGLWLGSQPLLWFAFGLLISVTAHFWAYPHTALPEANDFSGMCGHLKEGD